MIRYDEKTCTYYVQVEYKDPITKKRKTKKKRGFKLKREAKAYEAELIESVSNDPKTDYTFARMASLYVQSMEANQVTKQSKLNMYKNHCKMFYNLSMSKITKEILISWNNQIKDGGLAYRTINKIISYVSAVYKYANRIYGIKDITSILARKKKTSDNYREMNTLTVEEFKKLEECVENKLYRYFYHTLFWTGARRGEILALQCEDLVGDEICITKSIRYFKGGFTPLKNANSRRKIKLDNKTTEILHQLKEYYEKGFLFGGTRPLPLRQIDYHFKKAVAKAHVKKIRLHDLRHSHATLLINSGVNIVAVSKRLGHADITTTLKVYTHLLQKTDEEMMKKINILAK